MAVSSYRNEIRTARRVLIRNAPGATLRPEGTRPCEPYSWSWCSPRSPSRRRRPRPLRARRHARTRSSAASARHVRVSAPGPAGAASAPSVRGRSCRPATAISACAAQPGPDRSPRPRPRPRPIRAPATSLLSGGGPRGPGGAHSGRRWRRRASRAVAFAVLRTSSNRPNTSGMPSTSLNAVSQRRMYRSSSRPRWRFTIPIRSSRSRGRPATALCTMRSSALHVGSLHPGANW